MFTAVTTVTFKKFDKWLALNRYTYKDVADLLRVSRAAISLWKIRDKIPPSHHVTVERVMSGKIKLAK